jgi:hypothetical protein
MNKLINTSSWDANIANVFCNEVLFQLLYKEFNNYSFATFYLILIIRLTSHTRNTQKRSLTPHTTIQAIISNNVVSAQLKS